MIEEGLVDEDFHGAVRAVDCVDLVGEQETLGLWVDSHIEGVPDLERACDVAPRALEFEMSLLRHFAYSLRRILSPIAFADAA